MKFFVSFVVFISLVFLFGGLLLVGVFNTDENEKQNHKSQEFIYADQTSSSLTMKQIDSLTSVYNYPFTSANAVGSSASSNIQ